MFYDLKLTNWSRLAAFFSFFFLLHNINQLAIKNYKMNTNMLIFLLQRYKWNWPQCNVATALIINQKCLQLATIKISANGFSHNWANWSASLTASVMWAFLKPEITICLERLRWWYISVIHLACNGFMMLNFRPTLTSWAVTPLFNCWRTFSAYQSWYLSAMKHLALLFTEMSKGWNRFVWFFGPCVVVSFFFKKSFTAIVVSPLNLSNISNAFAFWGSFRAKDLL